MYNIKKQFRNLVIFLLSVSLALFPTAAVASSLSSKDELPFDVGGNIVLLIEPETGAVLFAQNEEKRVPIASITKVMTLLLIAEALERGDIAMDDAVTVSKTAADTPGSQAFLDAGAQYPVSQLIKSIIIASANDAAVVMAEHLAGSEKAFVDKMNKRAAELSMTNTAFKTCTGLPAEGQYSTAKDVSIMSSLLIRKQGEYSQWFTTWMDTLTHPSGRVTELTNTNRLVRFYAGTDGLKTGYSSEAKHCLAASATKNDMRLLAVLLGFDTSKSRFDIAQKLLDFGFAAYEKISVAKAGQVVKQNVPVIGSDVKSTNLIAQSDLFVIVKKGVEHAYEIIESLPNSLSAPLNNQQPIGGITIKLRDGTSLYSPVVIEDEEIGSGLFSIITRVISLW